MAKRYIRVNFLNSPSTSTPLNATNMNKLDKGIDDCDNAIEEIYAKRVNNTVTTNTDTFLAGSVGKLLQDQINAQNDNLVNVKTYMTAYIPISSNVSTTIPFDTSDLTGKTILSYYITVHNVSTTGVYHSAFTCYAINNIHFVTDTTQDYAFTLTVLYK